MRNTSHSDQLTIDQEKALVWIPRFSCLLSLFGSCVIIHMFRKRRHNDSQYNPFRIHHRFILLMSIFDIPSSIAYAVGTTAIPQIEETEVLENRYGTFGNVSTCKAQGFFIQLGVAVPMYNAALTIFYVCSICYNIAEEKLSRHHFEEIIHSIVLTFSLLTSVIGVALDLFHDVHFFCWFGEYPTDCTRDSDIECTSNIHSGIFRFTFGLLPIILSFIAIVVSMFLINATVYNLNLLTERKQAAIQALSFIGAYLLTWTLPFTNLILLSTIGRVPFSTNLLQAILMPMQGFFNAMVYIRPFIATLRDKYPNKSFFWIIRTVVSPSNQNGSGQNIGINETVDTELSPSSTCLD